VACGENVDLCTELIPLEEIESFPKIVHELLGRIKDVPEARRITQSHKHRN
jgi:hypothetical protein